MRRFNKECSGQEALELLEFLAEIDNGYEPTKSEIVNLKQILYLDLQITEITTLPPEIGNLTALKKLDLSYTQITELPPEIGNLTALQRLDLRTTKITTLPPEIGNLTALKKLNLPYTQITELPPEIGNLTALQLLFLQGTQITELPQEIGNLTALKKLDLSETQITELPPEIWNLTALQRLDLRTTKITTLPPEIGNLTALQSLILSGKQITELPQEIGNLTALQSLILSGKQITELPPEIGNLTALQRLDLSGLDLNEIPKELVKLNLPFVFEKFYFDEGINLYNTQLRKQPISLFEKDRAFIEQYYEEEKIALNESKVIFLGNGNAGKTYTIERLLDENFSNDTQSTQGIQIRKWTQSGENKTQISIWDFGGQEIMHSMHRCFLTNRCLYVVVLRVRDGSLTQQARYWLRNIQSFASDSKVFLAVNREQNRVGCADLNMEQLNSEFQGMIIETIEYCAKKCDRDNFSTFKDKIIERACELDSIGMDFPERWYHVKQKLEELANQYNSKYISDSAFTEICNKNGLEDKKLQSWVLDLFNDLGVCFSYHIDKTGNGRQIKDYKLLNPEWLINAIYAIISKNTIDGKINGEPNVDNGKVKISAIQRIVKNLGKSYSDEDYQYILEIMRKFRLSYKMNDQTEFIPALCNADTPKELYPTEYNQKLSLTVKYKFLPDSIIQRLIVDCEKNLNPEKTYKSGMRIEFSNLTETYLIGVVEMSSGNDELQISIFKTTDSNNVEPYQMYEQIKQKLDEINKNLGYSPTYFINVTENAKNASIPLNYVLKLYDNNIFKFTHPSDGDYNVIELSTKSVLGHIYSSTVIETADNKKGSINDEDDEDDEDTEYKTAFDGLQSEEERKKKTIFISHTGNSEEHLDWIEKLSNSFKSNGFNTIVDKDDLNYGDELTKFMEDAVTNSDFVIAVCSPEYKRRADKREGGVGYETTLISSEINKNSNCSKFIPILQSGTFNESFPAWACGKYGIDLSTPDKYDSEIKKLIDYLNKAVNNDTQ